MNLRKILCVALAAITLFSAAAFGVFAADENELPFSPMPNDYTAAAKKLQDLGILKGDGSGDLMLVNTVTRYQTALFFAQIITGKTEASVWNEKKTSDHFTDVIEYGTAIDMLAESGKIIGIGGGRFGYNSNILYRDMLVLCVRLLGEETEGMSYPSDYLAKAKSLGLCVNIDVSPDAELRRGETAQLMFNLLGKTPKDGDKTMLENFEALHAGAEPQPQPQPQPQPGTVDTTTGGEKSYMIALPDYAVEIGNDEKYNYRLTVDGLYDLRAAAPVTPFSIVTDTLDTNKFYSLLPGTLVYYNGNRRVTVLKNLLTAPDELKDALVDLYFLDHAKADAVCIDADGLSLPSADTAICDALGLNGTAALASLNIRLLSLNMTALDADDYDFEGAYLSRVYDEADGFDVGTVTVGGKEYYEYPVAFGVETLTAPTAERFDDFILQTAGQTVCIPRKTDANVTAKAHVELFIVGSIKRGALDLSVIKLLVAE